MDKKKITPKQFSVFHPMGSLGKKLTPVKDIMHKSKLPIAQRDTKLAEIIDIMVSNNRGAVLIEGTKGHLRGLISDGDLKRHLRKFGPDIFNYKAEDLMIAEPRFLFEDALWEEAIAFMNQHKITVLPVLSANKKIAGIVHLHDLLTFEPGMRRKKGV
jgi:arabinose-5-phosphate isomerase